MKQFRKSDLPTSIQKKRQEFVQFDGWTFNGKPVDVKGYLLYSPCVTLRDTNKLIDNEISWYTLEIHWFHNDYELSENGFLKQRKEFIYASA